MTASYESLIVLSGASTGMGAATARLLADRGYHVLAGVRNERDAERIRREHVEPVMLDITRPNDVAAVADRVAGDPQGRPLTALLNNAGMAANGPVETLPLDVWRRMFEVNVFGHIAMTQALLPALRTSRGRVVNISSTGGRLALPAFGAYSGTKFAVEAVSDALRREVASQGVSVVVVEPGSVRTDMSTAGSRTADELERSMTAEDRARYSDLLRGFRGQLEAFSASALPAERAARVIADAATTPRPRTRYTIGRDAALFTRMARLLPDRVIDSALAASQRRTLARSA